MKPRWRSLLFVPVNNARLVESAHTRGADALILDLEDAIPAANKPAARAALPAVIAQLAGRGATLVVRINGDALQDDLSAAVHEGVAAIIVPKVENVSILHKVDAVIGNFEQQRRIPAGSIGVIALIESPSALFQLNSIAAGPRLIGLAFGSEDFSSALGVKPGPESLTMPCQWVALAASAHKLMALGLPASVANFRELDVYRASAASARAIGMSGVLCIHPAQVPVINEVFAPSQEEVAWATAIMQAWLPAEQSGAGVAALNGEMIDKPVVDRARAILARHATGTTGS